MTSFDEWLHLRQYNRPCVGDLGSDPVEAEMFDRDGFGNIQVALLPHETLHIPFTFMSILPFTPVKKGKYVRSNARLNNRNRDEESKNDDRYDNQSRYSRGDSKQRDDGDDEQKMKENDEEEEEELASRTTEVRVVSCTHGHVVAVIRVNICPRPSVVNRTLRFFEPENGLMRRRIQLKSSGSGPGSGPGSGIGSSSYPGDSTELSKFVRCVEMDTGDYDNNNDGDHGDGTSSGGKNKIQSRVVVEWGPSGTAGSSSGALDVLLRYKCGTFPHTGSFYLLLYDDPYQSQHHEVS